jgi:hypothetical protein
LERIPILTEWICSDAQMDFDQVEWIAGRELPDDWNRNSKSE